MFTFNESCSPTFLTPFSPTFNSERGRKRLLEIVVLIEGGNRKIEKKKRTGRRMYLLGNTKQ